MKKKEKILLRAEIWHAPVARQMISWNTASLCCLVAISGVLDLSVFNIWSIWFYTKFSLYTLLVKSLRTPQFFKNGTEVNAELPEVFFFFFFKVRLSETENNVHFSYPKRCFSGNKKWVNNL